MLLFLAVLSAIYTFFYCMMFFFTNVVPRAWMTMLAFVTISYLITYGLGGF